MQMMTFIQSLPTIVPIKAYMKNMFFRIPATFGLDLLSHIQQSNCHFSMVLEIKLMASYASRLEYTKLEELLHQLPSLSDKKYW
jgi:hypothetical protein